MFLIKHGFMWGKKNITEKRRWHVLVMFFCYLMPAYAATPPLPFGSWSNQAGNIVAPCPAGFTCTDNVVSDNMIQRVLSRNNSGETYVQVIIDENTPQNGQHRSETFVNASNASGLSFSDIEINPQIGENLDQIIYMTSNNTGIATQMNISSSVGNTTMDYSVVLNTGWANNPGQPGIEFSQNITDTTAQNVRMDYTFNYKKDYNAQGQVTGWFYDIDQLVQNSAVLGPGNGGGRDDHKTVIRRGSGSYITAGTATLPPPGGMGGMGGTTPNPANGAGAPPDGTLIPSPRDTAFPQPPGTPGTGNPAGMGGGGAAPGGTVSWNTGNEVQVLWIGQVCPGCQIVGMGGMGGGNGFSFQQYENISTGQSAATRSYTSSGVFTWTNPPFGPQPPGL